MVAFPSEPRVSSRPKRACTERSVYRESSFESDDSDGQPVRRKRRHPREPAPREKNGCLTCRIRRKKCHGRTGDSEDCLDCTRLGIECLGWGEKRPEWLKGQVPQRVQAIKEDLLSRNMIKGHRRSSPGPDSSSGDPSDDQDESQSPYDVDSPTPDLLNPSEGLPPLEQTMKAVDALLRSPSDFQSPYQVDIGAFSFGQAPLIHDAPQQSHLPSTRIGGYDSTHFYDRGPYGQGLHEVHHSLSLDPHYNIGTETTAYPPAPSFSELSWPPPNHSPIPVLYDQFPMSEYQPTTMQFVTYYESEVLPLQYPLRERERLRSEMQHVVTRFGTHGILLLSSGFRYRRHIRNYPQHLIQLRNEHYRSERALLNKKRLIPTWGKALAGLQLVFFSFFNGTQDAPWVEPLDSALSLCKKELNCLDEAGLRTLLADSLKSLILRTTIWLDIFGAISLGREPILLLWYRTLFGRLHEDVLMMDELMGCSTQVMFLWAEIAGLEAWKDQNQHQLNTFELCDRARSIDLQLQALRSAAAHTSFHPQQASQVPIVPGSFGSSAGLASNMPRFSSAAAVMDESDPKVRRLIREAFRTSARIHLHCVASGYKPLVPAIREAVAETFGILQLIPETDRLVRSLTVPLFLMGVMAVEKEHLALFYNRVLSIKDPDLGLTLYVRYLVEEVGKWRQATNGEEVRWGMVMTQCEYKLQLLLI